MGVNPTSIAELHFPEVIINIALFSRTSFLMENAMKMVHGFNLVLIQERWHIKQPPSPFKRRVHTFIPMSRTRPPR